MLIRRERDGDISAIDAVHRAAFARAEDAAEPAEVAATPAEVAATPGQAAAAHAQVATTPGQATATPAQVATAPAENPTAPAENPATPAEVATAPRQNATAPGQVAAAHAQVATTPGQNAAAHAQVATTPGQNAAAHAQVATTPGQEAAEPAEVALVHQLRADAAWMPTLSLVAEVLGRVVGHVCLTRAGVGPYPVLALGPIGVLPEHQRAGVGSALMHAALGAADALDEPLVALLGSLEYYPRFGFQPGPRLGIFPDNPAWTSHFQVRPLTTYEPGLTGEFRYADPFYAL
ncbi:hypothetical protein NRB20_12560 [Nocardia sp. RB20]|uniref:N-acetyltransferase domain-containing protein n=1 Tax=Nocardia macrotermitis TaxID=2585198 RepID=A0A7K0CXG6_9NOCA|nr:hypothetical protein [Nocardia macrotermitis]